MVGLDCRCPVIACKVLELVFYDHLEDGMESQPGEGRAGFAPGGGWDSAVPSAALAAALEGAAGEGWRCEGGSRREIVGAVRAAAALESLGCAAKLGLIRGAIRQDDD